MQTAAPEQQYRPADLDRVGLIVGPLFMRRKPGDNVWSYNADALMTYGGDPVEGGIRVWAASEGEAIAAFVAGCGAFRLHGAMTAEQLRQLAMVAQEAADLLDALNPPADAAAKEAA